MSWIFYSVNIVLLFMAKHIICLKDSGRIIITSSLISYCEIFELPCFGHFFNSGFWKKYIYV